MTADRTVHARDEHVEIVRYDRAGKWYAEFVEPGRGPRSPLTIDLAVDIADNLWRNGGTPFFGRRGGRAGRDIEDNGSENAMEDMEVDAVDWKERALTAEAENERHRRANLVRAVVHGFEEWVSEAINAEDWDSIPWEVAEQVRAKAAVDVERWATRAHLCRYNLADLADQFQQVYETTYAPAPATENGVYHTARAFLKDFPA